MTDARTGSSGRRPVGGDVYPGGSAMPPGREEETTDRDDAAVSGVTPGQEKPERAAARDDRDDAGPAVLVAGDGPGHETDAGRGGEQLMPREECGQLERRLQQAVTGFVDEPRAAVEEADRAVEEITARFTDAVDRRRRTLRGSWQSADANRPGSADTEQLRLALRDYRELADRLLHM
ncbi:hypothetical protein [Streptomyces sp. Ag109_O5-10]|uniref:hypothetical protein n=1 Tax=Streptomyces sp. Ag109_O5-10 TaxID=1855349 RepID=UPI00089B9D10|nr:hypothetical protein [Streptomyces sp. Ag109_O5-10]SEF08241.1 hypothetical protein SAMN05216533_6023 [Streptomyces sp. Ag109_O5-10]